ncbi:MAG: hypothetical protein ABR905_03520 [Terracidiphilus sp.]|jgi:hypothetical protein
MKDLSSEELHKTIEQALNEVSRRLASGELDGSGRYYTDEKLAAGAATGEKRTPAEPVKANAARIAATCIKMG